MPRTGDKQAFLPGRPAPPPDWRDLPDPFGKELLTLLEDAHDIAAEQTWQQLPKLIARRWSSFTRDQSPLSTMGMIARCAETVLKIRLANKRGGGEEEAKRLEEFQGLMREIFFAGDEREVEPEPLPGVEAREALPMEADEEDADEA